MANGLILIRSLPLLLFVFMMGCASGGPDRARQATPSVSSMAETEQFPHVVPDGLGINFHTHTTFPQTVEDMRSAGFGLIRTNIYWNRVEKQKGIYDWSEYDALLAKLQKAGLRPLLAISFTNPLYVQTLYVNNPKYPNEIVKRGKAPADEEGFNAFAAYAKAAAEHYKGKNIIWEIWNEPDWWYFWAPTPIGKDYAKLASATCRAIKSVDPHEIVVGPSSSGFPVTEKDFEWWKPFMTSDALNCIDALSVHPYVHDSNKGPEINLDKFDALRAYVAQFTPRQIPIINSESGVSTTSWSITREKQAAWFVRNYLVDLMKDVRTTIWYDWIDDGTDPKEKEHNFGVMTHDGAQKPTYFAAQTLTAQLNGCTYSKDMSASVSSPEDAKLSDAYYNRNYALFFACGEKPPVLVVWRTSDKPKNVSIVLKDMDVSNIRITSMLGQTVPATLREDKTVSTGIGQEPRYITIVP